MNVLLEAITPVFVNGRIVEPGNKFSCSISHAKKLVTGESAKLIPDDNPVEGIGKKEYTKKELLELAEQHGVNVKSSDSKAVIEEALISAGVDLNATDL